MRWTVSSAALQRIIEEVKKGPGRLTSEPVPTGREAEYQGFHAKVRGHLMNHTLFLTERDECLAIGPDFTKKSDLVCIRLGCDAPVLLLLLREGWRKVHVCR